MPMRIGLDKQTKVWYNSINQLKETQVNQNSIHNLSDGTYLRYGHNNLRLTPDHGYWVASVSVDPHDLEDDHGAIFGVWVDTDTNTTYYDRVVFITELQQALDLARHNDQIAIWDNANNKEIRL